MQTQVTGNERSSKQELAGMKHAVDASGRVLRDNVWGPQDEDAARRDFTINAMYYDPETGEVIDYHGGIADAKKKVLRMIGDPATRYREDPVRIIRAVRFVAKLSDLGFSLEAKTAAPFESACSNSWPKCRKAACSTRCLSFCKPAMRWLALSAIEVTGFAKRHLSLARRCCGNAPTKSLSKPLCKTPTAVLA